MKISRFASIVLLGVALIVTPVYAQRGGGSRGGGGGRSGGSVSASRGGGGYSSSSRSSYSGSSRSYSSPSRSSSSSSSSRSYSSPSRSSSSSSSSRYIGTPSTPSSPSTRSSYSGTTYSRPSSGSDVSRSRSNAAVSRTGSVPDQVRSRSAASRSGAAVGTRSRGEGGEFRSDGTQRRGNGSRADAPVVRKDGGAMAGPAVGGRPGGVAPGEPHAPGYARPGHPGMMPPSHRPLHPAPYFWHPHFHYRVHCHQLFWDPFPPRLIVWPGFWLYCDSYWYDYHVTDIAVVRNYVKETYSVELITYAMSGDYMYALVDDPDGHTYIQVYDKNDKLLAEQQVNRKYCKMEIDPENGGCWIMKKHDKDPLLFYYTEDGQLLIYEADK